QGHWTPLPTGKQYKQAIWSFRAWSTSQNTLGCGITCSDAVAGTSTSRSPLLITTISPTSASATPNANQELKQSKYKAAFNFPWQWTRKPSLERTLAAF